MPEQNERYNRLLAAGIISVIILAATVVWRVAFFKPAPQIRTDQNNLYSSYNEQLPFEPPEGSTGDADGPEHEHSFHQTTAQDANNTGYIIREHIPLKKPDQTDNDAVGTKMRLEDVVMSARTWGPVHQSWYGKTAPDFTVTDVSGRQHKLSDYRGKQVMLIFWATWCGPCIRELPHLIALRNLFPEDKLAMLAISNENLSLVKKFTAKWKLNYTAVSADNSSLPQPFNNIYSIPSSFFIEPDGKIKLATEGLLNLGAIKAILQAE
jgi:peroxiredoxin